jgi:hypothetical protein
MEGSLATEGVAFMAMFLPNDIVTKRKILEHAVGGGLKVDTNEKGRGVNSIGIKTIKCKS